MKKVIIVTVLVAFGFIGYGQRPAPKYDTIKVVMLVTDTSATVNKSTFIIDTSDAGLYFKSIGVTWQYGYVLKQIFPNGNPPMLSYYDYPDLSSWYKYLDENKKPLPKNIVVWLTKEIKL